MTDQSAAVDEELFEPAEVVADDDAAEEFEISFDGDEEGDDTTQTPLFNDLRKQNRQLARENADLKAAHDKPIEIGPKPSMEACDYDEEKYDEAILAWNATKQQAADTQTSAQRQAQVQTERVQAKLTDLAVKERALNAPGYKEARDEVAGALNEAQQLLLIKSTKDGAKVIYALGKHPARLASLAAIDDPVDFVLAAAELERKLKMTNRKRPPEPETPVRGSAPLTRPSASAVEKKYDQMLTNSTPDERRKFREQNNLDVHGNAKEVARGRR